MRRPLALFGACFYACMLAAVRLPAIGLYIAAAVFMVAFAVATIGLRRLARGALALVLGACSLACCLRIAYDAIKVAPLQPLAGEEYLVTGRVTATQPGYDADTMHITLQVLQVQGSTAKSFDVTLYGTPPLQPGDVIEATVRFRAFSGRATASHNYAGGSYLAAAGHSGLRVTGTSHTLGTRMRQLQYAASANIRRHLPLLLSSVASAMTVGDRRFLSSATTGAYRAAGLSHLLVVSGFHLTLVGGMVGSLTAKTLRRRRVAVAVNMLLALLFVCLCGFTPSLLRSAAVYLVCQLGLLANRRADTLTSMALAAILLLCQNPYACADVGLQLSFAATFGVLWANSLQQRLAEKHAASTNKLVKASLWFVKRLSTPLGAAIFTLPVLAAAGFGFSLWSLPANLIATPFVAPILLCGFAMAIPASLPVLGWLGLSASVIGGTLLVFFENLCSFCAQHTGAVLMLGGGFALAGILAVYLLVYAGYRTRRLVAGCVAAVVLAGCATALQLGLQAGTVQVYLAGNGRNSSVVVVSGGQSLVLYRSRYSAGAVQRVLQRAGANDCVLFLDMRKTAESTEYHALFEPRQALWAYDIQSRELFCPQPGVELSVVRQQDGILACIDVAGYKIGVTGGSVSLAGYPALDVLIPAGGNVEGASGMLLLSGALPSWAAPETPALHSDGDALIWLRPGKSVIFKEVQDGIGNG